MEKWQFNVAELISAEEVCNTFLEILRDENLEIDELIKALREKAEEHIDDICMHRLYSMLLIKAEKYKASHE